MNPEDRRSYLVSLLPRGQDVAGALRAEIVSLEREILAHLGAGDLEGFRSVMQAITTVTQISVREESKP